MKCAFISDLHIKESGDKAAVVFDAFCKHPKSLESQKIFFLGDIFDLLIGGHQLYTKKYSFFFDNIVKLLNLGIEVIFIEGNHDFHFKQIFEKYINNNSKSPHLFQYLYGGDSILLNEKKYFYCHGYEVDYYNEYFKRWHKVYTSFWFRILTTYILPFFLIQKLGDMASKDSKKRGKRSFDYDEMKNKYLKGAKALIDEKEISGVIAGHTHVPEFHTFEDQTIYLNCGFPSRDKTFIHFNGKEFEKIKVA